MAFKSVEKVDMHEISKIIHGPKKKIICFVSLDFPLKSTQLNPLLR